MAAKFIKRSGGSCRCDGAQMTLDFFARSFVPENDTCSIAVLDSSGNLIARIGRYGDGRPLVAGSAEKEGRIGQAGPIRHPIGGNEVALFTPRFLAMHTDRRLFINDTGNYRILSVKLDLPYDRIGASQGRRPVDAGRETP